MHAVESNDFERKKIIADHPDILSPGLGRCSKIKTHLQLREDLQPRCLKARPVSFARLDAVDKELKRLQELDIITKVDYSNCMCYPDRCSAEAKWKREDLRRLQSNDQSTSTRTTASNSQN